MTEDQEQIQLCQYIKLQYPKVIFNTDLSGIKLTMGQAKKVKKMRSSRAFPDLVIYEPLKGYKALFIELKRTGERIYKKDGSLRKNEHIEEQAEMLQELNNRGYKAVFAIGFKEAKNVVDNYLRH